MYRLGVISDIHLAPGDVPPARFHNDYRFDRAEEFAAAAIRHCAAQNVDALILLGDVTHLGDRESRDRVLRLAASLRVPCLILPGNHDLTPTIRSLNPSMLESERERQVETGLELLDGLPAHGVGLERSAADNSYRGVLSVAGHPDEAGLVLFAAHFPLISLSAALAGAGLANAGDIANITDFSDLLANRSAPALVLHGHLHVRSATIAGSTLQLSCAALIEAPHEAAIVEIDIEALRIRRTCTPLVPLDHYQHVPTLSPATEEWHFTGKTWLPI